jgi:O-acetyl-ADP-ribose deacetylase (regulator of RNase III)
VTAPRTLAAFLSGRVAVRVGDLTREDADAVVNAANSSLLGGGGVDGALHRAAGPALLEACREVRRTRFPDGLPAGEAVATPGGNLPARWVIHTVGPVWGQHAGRERELLASCYSRSLAIAAENELEAIAEFLSRHELPREVRLVFFSEEDARVFLANHLFEAGA